jgi:hypothetical protein
MMLEGGVGPFDEEAILHLVFPTGASLSAHLGEDSSIELRKYFFTSLAPYRARNFSTTDNTCLASVMGTA